MMDLTQLIWVVSQIVDLLDECGRIDEAAWLAARKAVLENVDATADAREHVVGELHSVVPGMGGLMDLSLTPNPTSSYSAVSAREKLDSLCDRLYELTR